LAFWDQNINLYSEDSAWFPQCVIANEPNNTDPDSAFMVTMAPVRNGQNSPHWGGLLIHLLRSDGTFIQDSIESKASNGHYNGVSSSMMVDMRGNVHHVELSVDLNNKMDYVDTLIYRYSTSFKKGVLEYETQLIPFPVYSDSLHPKQIYDLDIAVDPNDTNIIYISAIAALNSSMHSFGSFFSCLCFFGRWRTKLVKSKRDCSRFYSKCKHDCAQ